MTSEQEVTALWGSAQDTSLPMVTRLGYALMALDRMAEQVADARAVGWQEAHDEFCEKGLGEAAAPCVNPYRKEGT